MKKIKLLKMLAMYLLISMVDVQLQACDMLNSADFDQLLWYDQDSLDFQSPHIDLAKNLIIQIACDIQNRDLQESHIEESQNFSFKINGDFSEDEAFTVASDESLQMYREERIRHKGKKDRDEELVAMTHYVNIDKRKRELLERYRCFDVMGNILHESNEDKYQVDLSDDDEATLARRFIKERTDYCNNELKRLGVVSKKIRKVKRARQREAESCLIPENFFLEQAEEFSGNNNRQRVSNVVCIECKPKPSSDTDSQEWQELRSWFGEKKANMENVLDVSPVSLMEKSEGVLENITPENAIQKTKASLCNMNRVLHALNEGIDLQIQQVNSKSSEKSKDSSSVYREQLGKFDALIDAYQKTLIEIGRLQAPKEGSIVQQQSFMLVPNEGSDFSESERVVVGVSKEDCSRYKLIEQLGNLRGLIAQLNEKLDYEQVKEHAIRLNEQGGVFKINSPIAYETEVRAPYQGWTVDGLVRSRDVSCKAYVRYNEETFNKFGNNKKVVALIAPHGTNSGADQFGGKSGFNDDDTTEVKYGTWMLDKYAQSLGEEHQAAVVILSPEWALGQWKGPLDATARKQLGGMFAHMTAQMLGLEGSQDGEQMTFENVEKLERLKGMELVALEGDSHSHGAGFLAEFADKMHKNYDRKTRAVLKAPPIGADTSKLATEGFKGFSEVLVVSSKRDFTQELGSRFDNYFISGGRKLGLGLEHVKHVTLQAEQEDLNHMQLKYCTLAIPEIRRMTFLYEKNNDFSCDIHQATGKVNGFYIRNTSINSSDKEVELSDDAKIAYKKKYGKSMEDASSDWLRFIKMPIAELGGIVDYKNKAKRVEKSEREKIERPFVVPRVTQSSRASHTTDDLQKSKGKEKEKGKNDSYL